MDDDEDMDGFLLRVVGARAAPPAGFLPLRAGERFGPYEVVGVLGGGGMGRVYAGRRVADGARLAIKVMRPETMARPELRARFTREARAVAKLRHPAIVPILDSGERRGLPYLVMPRLSGQTLRALLSERAPLNHPESASLLAPIASALEEAHERGITHRDVKPDNLWVQGTRDRAQLRLLDFGVARVDADRGLTDTGASFGTPRYMAPEQLRSAKDAGPSADQYSLAIVLHEMLTGAPPFSDRTGTSLVIAKATEPVPADAAIPAPVMRAIQRATAAAPEARFASIGDFAREALAI